MEGKVQAVPWGQRHFLLAWQARMALALALVDSAFALRLPSAPGQVSGAGLPTGPRGAEEWGGRPEPRGGVRPSGAGLRLAPPCDAPPEAGAAGPPVPVAAVPPWSSRTWARTAPGPPASAWVSAGGTRGAGTARKRARRPRAWAWAARAGQPGLRGGGGAAPGARSVAGLEGRAVSPVLPLAEGSLILPAARGCPARAGLAVGAGRPGFPPVALPGWAAALARG